MAAIVDCNSRYADYATSGQIRYVTHAAMAAVNLHETHVCFQPEGAHYTHEVYSCLRSTVNLRTVVH